MPLLETAVLAKMGAIAGKLALKSYFMSKMVALKTYLASVIGSQAAGISTAVLAAGCAAMYWEKKIMGNSDDRAVEAAVEKGMTEEAADQALRWLRDQGIF